jgi:hypothetical protein
MRLTPEIITAIQQLALEQRGLLGARAQWHVGDLPWTLCQSDGRENDWDMRLWTEEGRLAAWSWLRGDGSRQLEHESIRSTCTCSTRSWPTRMPARRLRSSTMESDEAHLPGTASRSGGAEIEELIAVSCS